MIVYFVCGCVGCIVVGVFFCFVLGGAWALSLMKALTETPRNATGFRGAGPHLQVATLLLNVLFHR